MHIDELIKLALSEDIGTGDVTTNSTVPENTIKSARIIAKEQGIIAGINIAEKVFLKVDETLKISTDFKDGDEVKYGDVVINLSGKAKSILIGERTALNFLGRLSGIATLTSKFVKEVKGTKAKIIDTRKTTPLLRELEKYSVRMGGGENHRFGLYDMVLIKDNHIESADGISNAIEKCLKYLEENKLNLKIEVETKNLKEVETALKFPIHRIMLDNMDIAQMKSAVKIINGKVEVEASGGVSLENVRKIAETGVDFISIGSLTHSAKTLDLSLLI